MKKLACLLCLAILFCMMNLHVAYAEEVETELEIEEEIEVEGELKIEVVDFDRFTEMFDLDNVTAIYMSDLLVYYVHFSKNSDAIYISFSIDSPDGMADELGFKNIYIHYKETGSSLYRTQAANNLVAYNAYYYDTRINVINPESGYSYRVKGTAYAKCNGRTYSDNFETGWLHFE